MVNNEIENLSNTELQELIVEAKSIISEREMDVENEAAMKHNEWVVGVFWSKKTESPSNNSR